MIISKVLKRNKRSGSLLISQFQNFDGQKLTVNLKNTEALLLTYGYSTTIDKSNDLIMQKIIKFSKNCDKFLDKKEDILYCWFTQIQIKMVQQ